MGLADTANLVVDLSLKGNFASQIKADQRALSGFDRSITNTQGRAYKAGQQIGTGIRRGIVLGVAAIGTLAGVLLKVAKDGQVAADVETIFAKAVANSGKVSVAQVAALKAQEEALLSLAGVDDELIKSEQTRLIQMGLTGAQVEKLTPLILDFSKATGIDLLTATKLAGKAVQGNVGALSRYGVQIDKAKAKTDPFAATVDALNHKFGGTTAALSGSLTVRLDVLREKLANLRDEAGIKLLPVFTRIVDVVGSKLVPAFGKLIDAVLPKVIVGLNHLADFLASGGATNGINTILGTIQTLLPAIVSGAEITGRVIGQAVSLFKSLPPEIQALAVAGFAVNKLTGGLVTTVTGGLISAVISQFKPLMNVTAGVVNVNGGVGVPGVVQTGEGGLRGLLKDAIQLVALPVTAVLAGRDFLNSVFPDMQKAQDALDRGVAAQQGSSRAFGGLGTTSNPLVATLLDRGGRERGRPDFGFGKVRDDLHGVIAIQRGVWAEFQNDLNKLHKATKPVDVAAAAKAIADRIGAGHGDATRTLNALTELRRQLRNTHDPTTAHILREAIKNVERVLPGRVFAAKELAAMTGILKDGKITTAEAKRLTQIGKEVKDRGLPALGKRIADAVASAKAKIAAATAYAGQQNAAAIRDKDLSVTVHGSPLTVNVTASNIAKARTTFKKAGNSFILS